MLRPVKVFVLKDEKNEKGENFEIFLWNEKKTKIKNFKHFSKEKLINAKTLKEHWFMKAKNVWFSMNGYNSAKATHVSIIFVSVSLCSVVVQP